MSTASRHVEVYPTSTEPSDCSLHSVAEIAATDPKAARALRLYVAPASFCDAVRRQLALAAFGLAMRGAKADLVDIVGDAVVLGGTHPLDAVEELAASLEAQCERG